MSKQVDERVVSMQFKNKQFERGANATIKTLDNLKKSLQLDGATKGLEQVDSAAKKIDLSGLGNAVETVRAKFSALQVMGITALTNLTNSAVNAGKRIVSSLTIDPIKTGFSEYETQINAVQTILANTQSKGKTLKDVNGALDELNAYADKTIYNFTEMTRNIGTFTAAGVDLDTSVNAIQGIANLAAVSGSTSQQASTAMYQLSQALASGTVKLMDWNSVVNAGMGGQMFQDALKETSKELGTGAEAAIKAKGSFRESLQTGWLTAEVLTSTLKKFTTSGANEYVAKYTGLSADAVKASLDSAKAKYGEADAIKYASEELAKKSGKNAKEIKQALEFARTAEDAATKVKTLTQLMDTLKEAAQSGWTQSWEIIMGDFEEAKVLFTEVSDTIGGIIGKSAESRNKLLQGWKDLGGRTAIIDGIRNAFNGIMNITKPISEAFSQMFPPTTAKQLMSFSEGFKKLTESFKAFTEKNGENIRRTFAGVFAVLGIGVDIIKAIANAFGRLFGVVSPAGDGILDFTAKIGDFLVGLRKSIQESNIFMKAIDGIANFLSTVAAAAKSFYTTVSEAVGAAAEKVEIRFEPLKFLGEVLKNVFGGLAKVVSVIAPWVINLASAAGNIFTSLMNKITGAVSGADYSSLFDLVNGGIFTAIGINIAKFVKSAGGVLENAGGFLDSIKGILDGVGDALNSFSESIKAKTLKTIATAIAILAGSLFVLSIIDSDKLTTSLGAVTALFIELFGSMSVFGKLAEGKEFDTIGRVGTAMIKLSAAVLVLALAMKIMSTMSWSEMGVGLISLTVGLGVLVGAVNLLPEKNVMSAAKAIKKLSSSVLVLAVAMKVMATMSWSELGVALVATAGGLGLMVAAVRLLPEDMAGKTAGLIGLATSMVILGAALKIMGSMSLTEMGKGLITLAGSLILITAAMNFMPKNMVGIGVGLIAVSTALLIMSSALSNMGGMSWGEIAKGLVTLAASLAIIVIAVNAMTGALAGAGALLVVAGALAVIAPVLKLLGSMSLTEIGKGLLSLAGVFAIIGVAGLLLGPLTPVIMSLAGSIALLGIGCVAVGAGILAFAAGITALSIALSAGGGAIVVFVSALIGLIPYLIQQIGVGIVAFCETIAGGAAAICAAIATVLTAILGALIAAIPPLFECIGLILGGILDLLVEFIPKMIDAGMKIIVGFLRGIADNIQGVVEAGFDIVINFIKGISEKIPDIIQAGIDLMLSFINGMADGIRNNTDKTIAAVNNLMDAIIDAVVAWWKNIFTKGGELVGKIKEGVESKISDLKKAGKNVIDGFIEGIKEKIAAVGDAAKEVGKKALNSIKNFLGIESPAKELIKVGKFFDEGMIGGLKSLSGKVANTAKDVGKGAMSAMQQAVSNVSDIINSDIDSQPTIRPVLDLSNIRSGVGSIGAMFSGRRTLAVDTSIAGAVSASMASRQNGGNGDVISAIKDLKNSLSNIRGNTYNVNGVTYDDGSNISNAVKDIVRAAKIERRR